MLLAGFIVGIIILLWANHAEDKANEKMKRENYAAKEFLRQELFKKNKP